MKKHTSLFLFTALCLTFSPLKISAQLNYLQSYWVPSDHVEEKIYAANPVTLAYDSSGPESAFEGASSWAIPELNKAAEYGLITNRIKSNMSANITREEFAEVAVRLYEIYTGKEAEAGNQSFTDTSNPEILKAANLNITTGIGGGKFGPNQLVTREQIATFIIRTLKAMRPDEDYSPSTGSVFTDDNLIDSWAREGVYYCSKIGIIKGIQDPATGSFRFDPDGNSTREMAVIICTRAFEFFLQNTENCDSTSSDWNGEIIIVETEFKQGDYLIQTIGDTDFIYVPYDRFKYIFKLSFYVNKYPEVKLQNNIITAIWLDDDNNPMLSVVMPVGSSTADINGEQFNIVSGPFSKEGTVYVPLNIFFEWFKMQSEVFLGRLCIRYPYNFPQEILEGSWSSSFTSVLTRYRDIVTGAISIPSSDWTYTFNSDGTYHMGIASSGGYLEDAILL